MSYKPQFLSSIEESKGASILSSEGPLFLVGMQRSGTKLLRTLLNEHPQISILSAETHFLPHWVKTWKQYGDLSDFETFSEFYNQMQKCPYFIWTKNRSGEERKQGWFDLCQEFSPAGVYEGLMRYDTQVDYHSSKIWGDKSTSYVNYLPLLKELFPNAKIIHIIRDVRDYCLSQNKAWGKHMIRASQRWVDSISKARRDSANFSQDYLEIKYEDLIENPKEQLNIFFDFLNIKPDFSMLTFDKASENIGDAKGYRTIKSDNSSKYLKEMSHKNCIEIEKIAGELLENLGYSVHHPKKSRRLSSLEMKMYRLIDGYNFFLKEGERLGLINTLKIQVGSLLTSRIQK